jgi:hypothetical protein
MAEAADFLPASGVGAARAILPASAALVETIRVAAIPESLR